MVKQVMFWWEWTAKQKLLLIAGMLIIAALYAALLIYIVFAIFVVVADIVKNGLH